MFNYNGCICDVCQQAFTPESDVVVCPECGTPHHRECYKELGHCVNEEKHGEGFVWNTPTAAQKPSVNSCPKCHTENPADAAFCENCGISLPTQQKAPKVPPVFVNTHNVANGTFPPVTPKGLEGEYDGVSYKDMAIYIGQGAPNYIFKFKAMEQNIKHFKPFSWSACFFDGFYFLYRKMWLQALFVIFITGILSAPSLLLMLTEGGVLDPSILNSFGNIEMYVTITSVLSILVKILLGYWAIPQYRKTVVKDIKRIKAKSATNTEYYQTLLKKSGPVKPVLYIALFLTALYFFM